MTYDGSLSLWPCAISAFLGEPHLADAKRDTFHRRGRRGWSSVLFMEERGVFPENSDMPRRFQNTVSSGSPELFSQLYVFTLPRSARRPIPPLGKASTGQAVCSLGTPTSSRTPKRFTVFQATRQSLPSRGTLRSGGSKGPPFSGTHALQLSRGRRPVVHRCDRDTCFSPRMFTRKCKVLLFLLTSDEVSGQA